jgi:hypothetical protein
MSDDRCPNGDGWLVRVTVDGVTMLHCPTCGHVESPHQDPLTPYRAQMAPVAVVEGVKTWGN